MRAVGIAQVPGQQRLDNADTIGFPRVGSAFPQAGRVQVDDRPRTPAVPRPRAAVEGPTMAAALPAGDARPAVEQRTVDAIGYSRTLIRALALLEAPTGWRGWLRRVFPNRRQVMFARLVRAVLSDGRLSMPARMALVGRLTRQADGCPGWCNDCIGDDDNTGSPLHHGVIGQLADGTQVCVDRSDTRGRAGDAVVALYNRADVLELDPAAADELIDLVAEARRVAIADRRAVTR